MNAGIRRINRGRSHSYTIDGQRADGVTTLLSDGVPKPALINWAANTTAEYAVDHWAELTDLSPSKRLDTLKKARYADLDRAARRGTEVHTLAEQLVRGAEIDVPDELSGHVESYVRFLDEIEPEPLLVETVVAHREWGYAGTLDLVARIDGSRQPKWPAMFQRDAVWVLDVKTTRSGIFPDVALQIAMYRHAEVYIGADGTEQPMADLGIEFGGAIHVRADGYDLIPLDTGERVFKDALHAIWVARMSKRWDEWRGDALQPTPAEAASA